MLQNLKQQGITILASTPYMDEASLCDRVALIQDGKLLTVNTPQGVTNEFGKPLFAAKSNNMLQLLNELKQSPLVEEAYPFGEYHHVVLIDGGNEEQLRSFLQSSGRQAELFPVKADIEDCFMALMKN